MPRLLLLLWSLQVCLQGFAAFRISKSGLLNRMPIIFCWFAVCSVISLVLFGIRVWHISNYSTAYSVACCIGVLLETACVVELFFAVSRYFRNFRKIGFVLLCCLWVVAVASSWAFRMAWVPVDWSVTWQIVMLCSRYADLAMTMALGLALLVLKFPSILIPTSAWRMSLIVIAHAFYGFVVSSLNIGTGNRQIFLKALLPLLGGCFTALATILLVTRGYEEAEILLPAPISSEELNRMEIQALTGYYLIKGATWRSLRRLVE